MTKTNDTVESAAVTQTQMPVRGSVMLSYLFSWQSWLLYFRLSVVMRPQADSSPALISDSVCAEDVCANLEPMESANCVYLDSKAWLREGKPVTVTG